MLVSEGATTDGGQLTPVSTFCGSQSIPASAAAHAIAHATALNYVFPLERKDGPELGTDIVPLPCPYAFILGERGRVREIGIGNPSSIHGFFQHERNQVVHLPGKGGGCQVVLRTLVAKTQDVAGLGLVEGIVEKKLPSGVSPSRIRADNAAERKPNVLLQRENVVLTATRLCHPLSIK
jgi:hypothetical protein